MKKLLTKLKNRNGFIAVDMLIVMAVLAASAVVWSSAEILMSAQQQNFYRTTAIFLAQGELNRLEYGIENGMTVSSGSETVNCNGSDFTVQKEIIPQNEGFLLKVKVTWYYENNLWQEQQERIIAER